MADNTKNSTGPDKFSALGMLNALTQTTPTSAAVAPTRGTSFSGSNLPEGRIKVAAEDTALVKKFVGDKIEVEKKPEQGMDLLTFYMLMNEQNKDFKDDSADDDFAADFEKFLDTVSNIPGFENIKNQEVSFGGRTMTLGELSSGFASNGLGMGMFAQTRFPPGAPMSEAAIKHASGKASPEVRNAIETACRMTGADRGAMFAIAKQESGFNPNARAGSSSATGLYQFLDKTWAAEVNKHGDLLRKAGIDPATASRTDPLANALMGAAFYNDNKASVSRTLGREASGAEVYMAHFLGAGGANKFFRELAENPSQMASNIFPGARSSNNFMSGKTLDGMMNFFQRKLEMS